MRSPFIIQEASALTANTMVLPKIERDAMSRNYGRFLISPLERGFRLTLDNALRRVMLSSLPGAAVTSIRVVDVHHEFSAVPHVREDMTRSEEHTSELQSPTNLVCR